MAKIKHGGFDSTTGGQEKYHSFVDNLVELEKEFPISPSGYFGERGKSKSSRVRNIHSEDPDETSARFFSIATNQAVEISGLSTGEGMKAVLNDSTVIVYRKQSHSDGSPAVDINIAIICKVKSQKIHFVK